jgi:hypothetical protein
MMADDWINDCMTSMLNMLARGTSFTYGMDGRDGTPVTSDHIQSVFNLDQEDIRLLMPEPRGLHSFCGKSSISMDVYDEQHLLRQSSDKIFIISDNTKEFRMSADEKSEMLLTPSESDLNILQPTTNTQVDKGTLSPARPLGASPSFPRGPRSPTRLPP